MGGIFVTPETPPPPPPLVRLAYINDGQCCGFPSAWGGGELKGHRMVINFIHSSIPAGVRNELNQLVKEINDSLSRDYIPPCPLTIIFCILLLLPSPFDGMKEILRRENQLMRGCRW